MTRDDLFTLRKNLLVFREIDQEHPFAYDGKVIATIRRPDSDIIHDFAHYDAASIRRRHHVNFGLGPAPEDHWFSRNNCPRSISYKAARKEEAVASLLGIYYEFACGLDWSGTLEDHGWDTDGESANWPWDKVFAKAWLPLKDEKLFADYKRAAMSWPETP